MYIIRTVYTLYVQYLFMRIIMRLYIIENQSSLIWYLIIMGWNHESDYLENPLILSWNENTIDKREVLDIISKKFN